METESRRVRMTKKLIRTALIELMQEKSFSAITIKELCIRADINRTTFYKHYTDQKDVLSEIEAELVDRTMDYMKDVSRDAATIDFIEAFLKYVRTNSDLFKVLFCSGGEHEKMMLSYMQNVLKQLRPNLPEYGSQKQEKYVLSFLMYGSFHVLLTWIEQDFDLPEKEVAELIYTMCDSISTGIAE
ncbi:MAG: TetR/AcrR family transcriptional regulator [Solobacterium sp.]|nr:TetR/AcrR family transcriptional regulator [Solobacterium sp.]